MIPPGFSAAWETAWNSRNLDRILAHYSDQVVFRSAKAVPLVGKGVLNGLTELRAYWAAALAQQPDLQFDVRDEFIGHDMMVITYANQVGRSAAETLRFGADGLVVEASACHGSEISQ